MESINLKKFKINLKNIKWEFSYQIPPKTSCHKQQELPLPNKASVLQHCSVRPLQGTKQASGPWVLVLQENDTHESNLQIKAVLIFAPSQSWLMYAFSHSHETLNILSRNILKTKFTSERKLNAHWRRKGPPYFFKQYPCISSETEIETPSQSQNWVITNQATQITLSDKCFKYLFLKQKVLHKGTENQREIFNGTKGS